MSRKAIGGLAVLTLISLCLPSQAEEAKITIIRPPPLAVKISPPSEARVVSETGAYKPVNQAVVISITTVAAPYYAGRYRWWSNWEGRYEWTGYGLRGGPRVYSGPRYPF